MLYILNMLVDLENTVDVVVRLFMDFQDSSPFKKGLYSNSYFSLTKYMNISSMEVTDSGLM